MKKVLIVGATGTIGGAVRQTATIVTGDESTSLNNCYIVRLENEDIRVVDRKTLTLAESSK